MSTKKKLKEFQLVQQEDGTWNTVEVPPAKDKKKWFDTIEVKPTFYTVKPQNVDTSSHYAATHGVYPEEVWVTFESAEPEYDPVMMRWNRSIVNRKVTADDIMVFATEYKAFMEKKMRAEAELKRNLEYAAKMRVAMKGLSDIEFKEAVREFKKSMPAVEIG